MSALVVQIPSALVAVAVGETGVGVGGSLTTGASLASALAVATEFLTQAVPPWKLICHQVLLWLRPVTSTVSPLSSSPTIS
jgi:hypothetical protein